MSLATSGTLFRSGRQKLAIIIHPHLQPSREATARQAFLSRTKERRLRYPFNPWFTTKRPCAESRMAELPVRLRTSLRRHYPHQVQGVCSETIRSTLSHAAPPH